MKKILIILGFSLFLLAGTLGALRLLVNGGEDTWICDQGEWVKHGAPNSAKPEGTCKK